MPNLLKKKSLELNSLLWKVFNDFKSDEKIPLPKDGDIFISNIEMPKRIGNQLDI